MTGAAVSRKDSECKPRQSVGVECPAEAGVNLYLHFLGELGPFYFSVYLLVNKETPFGGDCCSG